MDEPSSIKSNNSVKEKKLHVIPVTKNIRLEENLEIQFSSLQLKYFPISYRNFSTQEKFLEIIPLGTTDVQVGEQILHNVTLRAFVYKDFRLLEFKTREFRFAFSIELFDNVFFSREAFLQYELSADLNNPRLENIFVLFHKLFSGANIVFQYNHAKSELSIKNDMEAFKFSLLSSALAKYQSQMSSILTKKEKNFSSVKSSFYELEILHYYLSGKTFYDAWINAKFPKGEIQAGDSVQFVRTFSYPFQRLSYDIRQTITLRQELGNLGTEDSIQLNRKSASISLEAIQK